MFNALFYLRATSLANWLRTRVRRLRQPKYLIGAVVGCAYFYFFLFRPLGSVAPPPRNSHAIQTFEAAGLMPMDWLPLVTAIGALALLFFVVCMWVVPTERAALGFSEAEIAFLFPAPITRRSLVHFQLMSAQARSLVGAAIMVLFSNRWTFLGGNALTHALGWWFVFSGLNLHLHGTRFTLTRLADRGLAVWRRRVLVLLFIGTVIAATVLRLPEPLETPRDFGDLADPLVQLAQTAPLAWLLWPFEVVQGPFLAADAGEFLFALGPALAVIVLHYLWVVNSAIAFEEASVEHAEKRSARLAAWRDGRRRLDTTTAKPRRAPFNLARVGRPELAFLWKNLLSTWPYFTWQAWLGLAVTIIGGGVWLRSQPELAGMSAGLAMFATIFAGYVLLVGPHFARQDIRADLAHADILKTYPLAGWQIVLGELLTPLVILTGILWLLLLFIALTLPAGPPGPAWLTPGLLITGALGLAALAPVVATLQLLVPNATALVFPAWFQLSRRRGGGPEVMGQRMIFFFAQLLTMVVALLPAGLFLGAFVFISLLDSVDAPILGLVVGTLSALVILIAEVALGLWLLGRRFETLDLSAELRS